MENFLAKDIMVPISEYATVSKGASVLDSVLSLEKAQEEYTDNRYSHRAVLVLGDRGQVIGKFGQLDFLRLLEQNDEDINNINKLKKFGFHSKTLIALKKEHRVTGESIIEVFSKAAHLKVENFMQAPSEGEYIQEDAGLDSAIHQLVAGLHLSLLVLKGDKIVGVLRLSDVFAAVFHALKNSELIKT